MKLKLRKKIVISIITIFFVVMFAIGNINAVNIKYKADGSIDGGVVVRTIVKSHTDQEQAYAEEDINNNSRTKNASGSTYARTKVIFSTKSMSVYKSGKGKQPSFAMAYDKNGTSQYISSDIDILSAKGKKAFKNQLNKLTSVYLKAPSIKKRTMSSDEYVTFTLRNGYNSNRDDSRGNKHYVYVAGSAKLKVSSGSYASIQDFVIPDSTLEYLKEKNLLTKVDLDGEQYYKVYISFVTYTKWRNVGEMRTAYDAAKMKDLDYWDSENWGFEKGLSTSQLSSSKTQVGGSILNNYDNILYIPADKIDSGNVRVCYYVEVTDASGKKTYKNVKSEIKTVDSGSNLKIGKGTNTYNYNLSAVTAYNTKLIAENDVYPDNYNLKDYYVGYKYVVSDSQKVAHSNIKTSTNVGGTDSKTEVTVQANKFYDIHYYFADRRVETEERVGAYIIEGSQTSDVFKTTENKTVSTTGVTKYVGNAKYVFKNAMLYLGGKYELPIIVTEEDTDQSIEYVEEATDETDATGEEELEDTSNEIGLGSIWDIADADLTADKIGNFTSTAVEERNTTSVTIPQYATAKTTLDENEKNRYGDFTRVEFNYELEKPRAIYVRHVKIVRDASNNIVNYELISDIKNDTQSFYNSLTQKWLDVKNGFNQRKFVTTGDANASIQEVSSDKYSEKYTIDRKDKMKITASSVAMYEGKEYKLVHTTQMLENITNDRALQMVLPAETNASSTVEVYQDTPQSEVITFYYDYTTPAPEEPGDPYDTPELEFSVKGFSKTTDNCGVTYTPVNEELYTYINAAEYIPYTVVYYKQTNADTGVITYRLKELDQQVLENGNLTNSRNTQIGTFVGSGKNTVYNNKYDNSSTNIPITLNTQDANQLLTDVKNSVSQYNGTTPQNVKNIQVNYTNKTAQEQAKTGKAFYYYETIAADKYNGLREPSATVTYKVYSVIDNGVTHATPINTGVPVSKNVEADRVNIYTPIDLNEPRINLENGVVHIVNSENNTKGNIIQPNTEFTLKISCKTESTNTFYKNTSGKYINTSKYCKGYIVKLGFKVIAKQQIQTLNADYSNKEMVAKDTELSEGTIIYIPNDVNSGGTVKLKTKSVSETDTDNTMLNITGNNMTIYAVTVNEPINVRDNILGANKVSTLGYTQRIDSSCDKTTFSTGDETHRGLGLDKSMYLDSLYYVKNEFNTYNLGRIYDFKVTDCLDLAYKQVFRKNDNPQSVNDLTGVSYYSGIKKYKVYSSSNNTFENRADITKIPSKTIIPLAAYKNTNTQYINAPKLGYRISYDLKTTGIIGTGLTRKVQISPSYYFISKNGQKFYESVDIYYKNSSGKYVKFDNSNYKISFNPNSGYRNIDKEASLKTIENVTTLSAKLVSLNIGASSFDLSASSMMTKSDNNYIQCWYGEFKLPNSSIIVESGKNPSQSNNILKDGYVGVKFGIRCIDTKGNETVEISYDVPNAKASSQTNTTQWDYEGFLGFNTPGEKLRSDLKLQLEKGTWNINDITYQKIKGTVILYDADNRAADDYN